VKVAMLRVLTTRDNYNSPKQQGVGQTQSINRDTGIYNRHVRMTEDIEAVIGKQLRKRKQHRKI